MRVPRTLPATPRTIDVMSPRDLPAQRKENPVLGRKGGREGRNGRKEGGKLRWMK